MLTAGKRYTLTNIGGHLQEISHPKQFNILILAKTYQQRPEEALRNLESKSTVI
jgi:hypothetical protein